MTEPKRVRGIKRLVDRGFKLNSKIKMLNNELDGIKADIKRHAKATIQNNLSGYEARVVVSDKRINIIKPMDVWKLLKRNMSDFQRVVSIKVGLLRDLVGSEAVDKITKSSLEEFFSVRFYGLDEKEDDTDSGRPSRRMDTEA